jgi:hypothetical protein
MATVEDQVMEVLSDPMNLPSSFWDYMVRKWLQSSPVLPISQIFGFTQFTAQSAAVATSEATGSTTYADLATVGPTISGLADGHYVLLATSLISNSTGSVGSFASPSLNGSTPLDSDAAIVVTSAAGVPQVTAIGASIQTLSSGNNNTIKMQYRVGAGSGTFTYRKLIALKYGNL